MKPCRRGVDHYSTWEDIWEVPCERGLKGTENKKSKTCLRWESLMFVVSASMYSTLQEFIESVY